MSADTELQSGIAVLAAARPLNSVFAAFTSSLSLGAHAPAASGRSWPGAGEDQQVIGEHPQSNPPLHAAGAAVPAPPQSVTAFECADASFAACAPAQGCARGARPRLPMLARQHDVPDPAVLRAAFIAPRGEATVGDRQLRRATEERDVPIQSGRPERAFRLAALTHLVVRDELRLRLLDLHQPAEFRRLGQLPLSDDLGVRLEDTDHLARKARIAAE